MTRHPDWHSLLHSYFMEREHCPFAWGRNDCALFACDGILRITNTDIARDFRGRYTTAKGSLSTLRKVTGGTTVLDAALYAAAKYGLTKIAPLHAGRGDLVLMPNGEDTMLALVRLNGIDVAAVTDNGLADFPLAHALRAWRVG